VPEGLLNETSDQGQAGDVVGRGGLLGAQDPQHLLVDLLLHLLVQSQHVDRPGVAAILYESRLGCLEEEVPRETEDYIGALHLMFNSFKTTMYAGAIPRWLRPLLPGPWDDFCSSWDGLFNFSKYPVHVGRRLEKLRGQMERGEDVRGGLLTHMLVTMEMSLEEIYANVTEMLLAGVDTTLCIRSTNFTIDPFFREVYTRMRSDCSTVLRRWAMVRVVQDWKASLMVLWISASVSASIDAVASSSRMI
ncbi:hypothetical protein CRUP_002599, partial [Coryphaenoides rupestris]